MKTLFKLYFSIYRFEYNKLIKDYYKSIDVSLKKNETRDRLTKLINDKYIKIQNQSNILSYEEIKNILGRNKNENFDSAIMQLTKSDSKKIRDEKIKNFSILQAYKRFTYYLSDINKKHQVIMPKPKNNSNTKINENNINKEFTVRRQVLAIHYLLKSVKYRDDNKSEKARLIQFLTGRESTVTKIKDTNIIKIVDNLFPNSDNALYKDLNYIREFFEKLGIKEIVDEINKEISKKE